MNEQTQINDLKAYEFERSALENPDCWMRAYVNGNAICETDLGDHFFPLSEEEKEFFQYGFATEFQYVQDCETLPQQDRESIEHLQEVSTTLEPLGLAAVTLLNGRYTLYSDTHSTYFAVHKSDLAHINSQTLQDHAPLVPCGFDTAPLLRLDVEGCIVQKLEQ